LLIRWHHEWWNGGGYPDGLAGKAIPPGARILRAVDSYFALISDRPHRRRFDRIEAEQIIADLAGIEFDPQVVNLLLQVLAEEEAVESAFVYPAPGGDEAVSRMVEDQPQSPDEIAHAPAYAARQMEIPAEPSGGGQGAAPDFVSSQAPDGFMGEAVIENRPEIAGVDFASSEAPETATDEVEGETHAEAPAANFASSNAIEEAGIEVQTEMAGDYFASPETPDEVMAGGRMEMAGSNIASPNIHGAIKVESRTEMTTAEEGLDEELDKAGVQSQTEMVGAETQVTQEKIES
jgi:hypothetical protein